MCPEKIRKKEMQDGTTVATVAASIRCSSVPDKGYAAVQKVFNVCEIILERDGIAVTATQSKECHR